MLPGDEPPAEADGVLAPLASALAGKPTAFVNADVALDGEPVVGSFTVDGMIFALSGDGATLVAVAPGASGLSTIPSMVSYGGMAYDVVAIGAFAFYLSGATEVALPASVSSVDERAFRSSDVAWVEVDPANPGYASFDGILYDASLTRLLLIPEGRQGAVRIDRYAEEVDPSAFSHCAGVDAISVDAGSADFASWDGLLYDAPGTTLLRVPAGATAIAIREGCTAIAAGAMEGCAKLETINAPSTVTSISPDVFSSVPTVNLPAAALATQAGNGAAASNEAQGSVPQISALVALAVVTESLPHTEPDEIELVLSPSASSEPWLACGFEIETNSIERMETAPPLAGIVSSDSYGASIAVTNARIVVTSRVGYGANANQEVTLFNGYYSGSYELLDNGKFVNVYLASYTPLSSTYSLENLKNTIRAASGRLEWTWFDERSGCGMWWADIVNTGRGSFILSVASLQSGTSLPELRVSEGLSGTAALQPSYRDHYTDDSGYIAYSVTYDVATSDTVQSDMHLSNYRQPGCQPHMYVRVPVLTRPGYVHRGWAVASNSSTVAVQPGYLITGITANRTYYAVWEKRPIYAIALSMNDGVGSSMTIRQWTGRGYYAIASPVDSSTPITSISVPTRPGFVFKGYYDAPSGGSMIIGEDGVLPANTYFTSNATLYAQWTPLIAVDVPASVTARIDLLGIEGQQEASGYIRSLCGEPLRVEAIECASKPGASALFGPWVDQVRLEVSPGAAGGGSVMLDLGADGFVCSSTAPASLTSFLVGSYGDELPVAYRFAIPSGFPLESLAEGETEACRVSYTVALA